MIEIQKNSREIIRIEATEFKGYPLISMRIYFREDPGGEWKPSRKGLTLRHHLVPELVQGIQELMEENHV